VAREGGARRAGGYARGSREKEPLGTLCGWRVRKRRRGSLRGEKERERKSEREREREREREWGLEKESVRNEGGWKV